MRVKIGQRIRLSEQLRTRCCSAIIPAGDKIEVYARTSTQPAKKLRTVNILHPHHNGKHGHCVRTSWIKGEVL